MNLPFTEIGNIRTFAEDVQEADLQWHWDQEDRVLILNHETDWKFQFDNELPIPLLMTQAIFIEAGRWHRLIKGSGPLSVTILKNEVQRSS